MNAAHPRHHDLHIERVIARRILDSRGWPTVSVQLHLHGGGTVTGSAPAGASTGEHEAVELRDGGPAQGGRGVERALTGIREEIAPVLTAHAWSDLAELDAALAEKDASPGYARLGANAIIATSQAAARGFAHRANTPLWRWIAAEAGTEPSLPVPHFNVLNGGAHATNGLAFQEFMIAPVGAEDIQEAVDIGADVYHALRSLLVQRFGAVGLGDEGGFAPPIDDPEAALDLLVEAIETAGLRAGVDRVAIALDPAANGLHDGAGHYRVAGRTLDREELGDYYEKLLRAYPIRSIEDGYAEDDEGGWRRGAATWGSHVQTVGDDLLVTDPARIERAGRDGLVSAALIKPNQNGTVTGPSLRCG